MRLGKLVIAFFILLSFNISYSQNISFEELLKLSKDAKKNGKVYFNFDKIDLKLLTYFISSLTQKNIVLGSNVKGEVSLIFSQPISIEDAWNIYTSVLKSRNYVLVNKGSFYEVVPSSSTRNTTPPLDKLENTSDELITYVYKVKYVDIIQLSNILRGLKSPRGVVFSYNPANIVIITDFKAKVKSLKQVISLIDTPSEGYVIKVFKLNYADSAEVSSAISSIFSDLSKRGIVIKSFNLKSQNAILVKAPRFFVEDIENMISKLDKSFYSSSTRSFYTIKLENSKAEELANILNKLLENIKLVSKKKIKKGKNRHIRSISNKDKPKVVADKVSNSIIVYANKTEFEAIKKLVESLDKEKKQVLVTAFVTEVSEQALKEIGIRWQAFGKYGGASFKGGLSEGDFYGAIASSNFVVGAISTSGKTVSSGGATLFFPDLLFLFSLLERGTGFNIVSSPKILTMDNIEAIIKVAQRIPFAQSLKFDVNGNPIINYDYQDVGLVLKVTPHISYDSIVMDIHQEVNEVIGFEKPQIGNISYVVPITSRREITTSIKVKNGKTVVLGGLVSKKTIKTMEGVPFFSSIPIIGNLFKYNSEDLNKTNLFIFITPYIINKPEDLAKITEEHRRLSEMLMKNKISKKKKYKQVKIKSKNTTIFEDYNKYFGR
ncbi:MAG TPA: type II secretion system protein GspD [Persephonella sp.]|nr:type II secretion system protein GspD [Hydrogenothermaceae bacterium]HIQ25164.1 type II secretion system protein GspD [Persephonella sp.]